MALALPPPDEHDRWLEMRRTGFGGSDAAAALGLNRPSGSQPRGQSIAICPRSFVIYVLKHQCLGSPKPNRRRPGHAGTEANK